MTLEANPVATFVDRVVEVFAPRAALRRQYARNALSMGDGYDAAKTSRRNRTFTGRGGGADVHTDAQTLFQLREQCLHHDRTSALLAGLLNTAVDEIVGPTFTFKPITPDDAWNELAAQYVLQMQTAENTDARGQFSLTDQAKLTLRSLWTSGDILHVWQPDGRLATYEAHEIVSPRERPQGTAIVNGVQFDKAGRASHYYVPKPAVKSDRGYVQTREDLQRIPAADALFVATRKRFNQSRGVPFLAPVLSAFNRLDGYIDAEMFAAHVNAHWAAKITREPVYDETDPNSDLPGSRNLSYPAPADGRRSFDRLQTMEPGMILDLLPGEDLDIVYAQRPGNTFEPFVLLVCRMVGVGVGMPLELFLKDFSRTNYSSARASMNVAKRSFRGWQLALESKMCSPWYRRHITRGIASKELPLPKGTPDVFAHQCQWPQWEHVDPMKEIQADALSIQTRLRSRGEVIRARNGDPAATFAELAEEENALREAGLLQQPQAPQQS